MTREEKEKLIRHLRYNLEIGADYLITDKDVVEIIKALEQEPILDKVRAEIADLDDADYDYEGYYKAITDALQIIDKYKADMESEE